VETGGLNSPSRRGIWAVERRVAGACLAALWLGACAASNRHRHPAQAGDFIHRIACRGWTLSDVAAWRTRRAENWHKLIAPVNPDLEVCCTPLRIGSEVRIPRALLVRRDEPPCDVAARPRPAVAESPAPPSLPEVIPPDAFGLPQAAPSRNP
jgi:hypothetical protein